MKKAFLPFVFATFVLFLFIGCKKNKLQIDPGFSEYISAFTSGEISVSSPIRIELTDEYPKEVEPNAEVEENVFSFSPSIDGKAYWIDKRTIEFRPENWLKSGETYTAKFFLNKLKKVPSKFKTFKFEFATIKQAFGVNVEGYEPYMDEDLKWNKVTGSIQTADVVDVKKFESILTAEQSGKKLTVKWQHNDETNKHSFTVDSVFRGEKEGLVKLSWNGKVIDCDNKSEEEVKIPSIYDFLVLDAKAVQDPNQRIEIRFSDPIGKKQDLNGLITTTNSANLNFEIEKNVVKVYFSSRVNGSVKLRVESGVKNSMGTPLKKSFETTLQFENIKPAVRLMGNGVILPNSNGLIFPFEAVNLRAVDVRIIKIFENNVAQFLQINKYDGEYQLKRSGRLVLYKTITLSGTDKPLDYGTWNTFSLDLSELIKQEPGAIYRVELSFKKAYSTYPCEGESTADGKKEMESIESVSMDDFEQELAYWDAGEEDYSYDYEYEGEYDYGEYDYNERDNPCSNSYFTNNRKVSRNIIASNLGIIAKGYGNNNVTVAIADIITAKPMQGVTVDVLNYQQQVIGTASTDGDGFCTIVAKGKPYLVVAKKDEQKGYLRVDDGSALSLSLFDVSGQTVQKGIKGFIYGERGVWRPGDTVYLTCIIEDKQKQLPPNHPVVFELYTPQGQLYKKIVKTSGINGFYQYTFKTDDNSPTGNWQSYIKIGSITFSKTLKIETVKPNRLKVNFDVGKSILSLGSFTGNLSAKWLHGAPAKGLKVKITANLSKMTTSFKGFEEFTFDDPVRPFDVEEKSVFEGNLDNDGNASVSGDISLDNNAPGLLRASILTRVYEPGGEFSIDNQVVTVSPYMTYVGVKLPVNQYGYLETDTNNVIQVVTVNKDGKTISKNNLEVYIYKLDRNWWWNASDEVLANYESNTYATPVFHKKISTVSGKTSFNYRLNYPDWGRFLVRVVDNDGGHATGRVIFIDWPGWRSRADRGDAKSATMLTFSSDKPAYNVGEKATITFPRAKAGKILVSIESGASVIKQWWEDCDGKDKKVTFDVTEDMAPNVYIFASLIQPHSASGNDLPIRLYGVIPMKVENPNSHLNPVITMPEVVRPEEKFTVKISEKNSKKMTYTLAIVDEGLLDITRFKTPDPWTEFYGREALGVKTWDLYDYIIGAYGGKIEKLFSIGGDGELKKDGDKKANRFKSVVKFLGPFEYTGGTDSHEITLPQYVGSVKVMVVAGQETAFGNAEKTVAVRKPLMVLASLPRVVGPNESLTLPVSVFALEKQVKNVQVEVQSNGFLQFEGSKTKSISFSKPGESDLVFNVKVQPKLGVGKVKVIARSGSETDYYEIEIDVRNPNTRITQYFETTVESGKTGTVSYTLPGMDGTNKATLEVSSIPPIDLTRRLGYLISYPHGCAEQTTSGAFPQLFLDKVVELNDFDTKRIKENVTAAVQRLNTMQLSDGGVAYWPGLQQPDLWITNYVGHFMILAKEKGYTIPSGFIKSWTKFQKKEARNWEQPSTSDAYSYYYYYQSDLVQAYRLYTLALVGDPDFGAMNRMKEMKGLSVQSVWRLAAAYALAGQPEVAKQLMMRGTNDMKPYSGFNYTYGSLERDWAMVLETYALVNDKSNAFTFMKKVGAVLSSKDWMSTQSTAYCLYAIGKSIELLNFGGNVAISYTSNGKAAKNIESKLPVAKVELDPSAVQGSLQVVNKGKGTLFVRVIGEGIPEVGPTEPFQNGCSIDVEYVDTDGNPINIDNIEQGKDLDAIVTVRNTGQLGLYKDMALTQIFPSGFEIINTRFLEMEESEKVSPFTYQDVRDDRVMTYFNLERGETKTFKVRLNASYSGRFYCPGVYVEAMYESKVNAFSPGKWIEIK